MTDSWHMFLRLVLLFRLARIWIVLSILWEVLSLNKALKNILFLWIIYCSHRNICWRSNWNSIESLNKEQNVTPVLIISCSFQKGAFAILCDCLHYFRVNADERITAQLFSIDLSASHGTTHKHAYAKLLVDLSGLWEDDLCIRTFNISCCTTDFRWPIIPHGIQNSYRDFNFYYTWNHCYCVCGKQAFLVQVSEGKVLSLTLVWM